MIRARLIFASIALVAIHLKNANSASEVYWAVNCGGDAHTDIQGIRYQKDMLTSIGTASDYGKTMTINRVPTQDQVLYQTERYHTANFAYDVPIPSDGDYVLVLKFSEVWFTAPNQKVFDVTLNNEHTIVDHLDIYAKVGRGTGHDEIIPFKVKDGKLYVNEESSDLYYNKVPVEFIKGDRDNPKINAIVLIKGSVDDVPKLPPLPQMQSEHDYMDDMHKLPVDDDDKGSASNEKSKRKRPVSGPRTPDPYATDDPSTMLIPILVSIGAFLPILFCLCKL